MRKVGWQDRTIKRIAIFKQEHPLMTLQQIANHFEVSRPYIYKILKNNGEPTNNRLVRRKAYYCTHCQDLLPSKRKFCSDKCSFNYRHVKVSCAICHVPFYRKKAVLRGKAKLGQTYIYCSMKCMYKRSQLV